MLPVGIATSLLVGVAVTALAVLDAHRRNELLLLANLEVNPGLVVGGSAAAARHRPFSRDYLSCARGCAVVPTGHELGSVWEVSDEVVWVNAGTTRSLGSPEEAKQNWHFRREFLG